MPANVLFEVNSHHDVQIGFRLVCICFELGSIFKASFDVVHGTRSTGRV